MRDAAFYHLYSGLPRVGPGEPADVGWALDVAGTPQGARILDAGCGPGGDTGTLLEHPGAMVTAVDAHAPFVEELRARHPAVTAFAGDMATAEGPFDLIWCAGALYFLGITSGLAAFRPRLAEGGAIAFSEPCHFTDTPSGEAIVFWEGYPARTEAKLRDEVEVAGYRILATRRLSDAAWDAYYAPLTARAAALKPGAAPDLLEVIGAAEAEAALWNRVKGETGYLLVVARPA
jgi:trans-aconitate methyltransferase